MTHPVEFNLRHAGGVSRYHTWPTLRSQSVAEHSWQLYRIYMQIFKFVPANVAVYIMFHDAAEVYTGDPPFPIKRDNPALKGVYDDLEAHFCTKTLGYDPVTHASELERKRVKVCDLLEMWEFGQVEMAMGNAYAEPIVRRTIQNATKLVLDLPEEDRELVHNYVSQGGMT